MIPAERAHLSVTAVSHPGMTGKNNEDRYAVSAYTTDGEHTIPALLAVVADGIGGHRAGEVAAEIAVETISTDVAKSDASQPLQTLRAAIVHAGQVIREMAAADPAQEGMGSTCACACAICFCRIESSSFASTWPASTCAPIAAGTSFTIPPTANPRLALLASALLLQVSNVPSGFQCRQSLQSSQLLDAERPRGHNAHMECAGTIAKQTLSAPADHHQVMLLRQLRDQIGEQFDPRLGLRIYDLLFSRDSLINPCQFGLIQVYFMPELDKMGFIDQQKTQLTGDPSCKLFTESPRLPRYRDDCHFFSNK